ncbi:MAG: DEAD/DEAH box helicase [Bacillota bacterium]
MSLIYDALRPYQREAAYALRRMDSGLLSDQPGLGKTIQTLGTIIAKAALEPAPHTQRWHLIVCPSVAIDNVWVPEIHRWLADQQYDVIGLSDKSLPKRAKRLREFDPAPWVRHVFVVVNIESCRIAPEFNPETGKRDIFDLRNAALPPLFERIWDTIVVDESHRALIRKTGIPTATRKGFTMLRSRRRIALSGTPMRGKPEQLWGTLNWCRPDLYTSYWKWVARYFEIGSSAFSNYVLGDFLPGGEERMGEDLKSINIRRTKAEVAADLPPKQYGGTYLIPGDPNSPFGVWLEPTTKQAAQIKAFERDGVIFGETEEAMAQGTLAMDTRRKQLASGVLDVVGGKVVPTADSPKLEWILEWLDNADGEQLVIASQFTALINEYAEHIRAAGYSVTTLTGETSQADRTERIAAFQAGEIQVFMLNTMAGGVAITLDAADYLVLLDETFVPDDQEQVEDRIHRVSRIHNVTIYYLRTLGTIEEEIAFIVAAREDVTRYLLDGARGVENARRLYETKKKGEVA